MIPLSVGRNTDLDWIWDSPVFSVVAIAIFAIFALTVAWEIFGRLVLNRITVEPDDTQPDSTDPASTATTSQES